VGTGQMCGEASRQHERRVAVESLAATMVTELCGSSGRTDRNVSIGSLREQRLCAVEVILIGRSREGRESALVLIVQHLRVQSMAGQQSPERWNRFGQCTDARTQHTRRTLNGAKSR
jgi:hypothetical protein